MSPRKSTGRGRAKAAPKKRAAKLSIAHLDGMIEEATVDCHNESEQMSGFFTMIEDHLVVPFMTMVLGAEVTVESIELNDANEIVAVCRRGRDRQCIHLLDLPLPDPKPSGAEWIDALRRWAGWR